MQHLIATYGYLAVFVLMLAESACIPVPSELIMTFGGALAAGAVPGTSLNLVGVILAGTAGNVAGSYVAWAAGRYLGLPALSRLTQGRWARRLRLREHDLDRAVAWFGPSIVSAFHGPTYVIAAVVLLAIVVALWRYLRRRPAEQPPAKHARDNATPW